MIHSGRNMARQTTWPLSHIHKRCWRLGSPAMTDYVGLGRDKVCVILYIYPAECRPKAHGSSGRLFYISVSCPQTGLASHNSRAPQPPEGKNKGKTRETAPGRFRTQRKGNKGRAKESHNLSGARLSLLILTVLPLSSGGTLSTPVHVPRGPLRRLAGPASVGTLVMWERDALSLVEGRRA